MISDTSLFVSGEMDGRGGVRGRSRGEKFRRGGKQDGKGLSEASSGGSSSSQATMTFNHCQMRRSPSAKLS